MGTSSAEPTYRELEAAIREEPGNLEAYLVLADALLQGGHPRGELIALMARGVGSARVEELTSLLLPSLGDARCEWRWGFVSEASRVSAAVAGSLLRDPGARFLERLQIQSTLSALCRLGAESLRKLHVTSYGEVADLAAVARAFPRLEMFQLHVDGVKGSGAPFRQLERLDLFLRSDAPSTAQAVAAAELPVLQTLTVTGPARGKLPVRALAGLRAPALRELVIRGVPLDAREVELFAAAPWVRRLERLSLDTFDPRLR